MREFRKFLLYSKMHNLFAVFESYNAFFLENAVHIWKVRQTRTQISIRLDSNLIVTFR